METLAGLFTIFAILLMWGLILWVVLGLFFPIVRRVWWIWFPLLGVCVGGLWGLVIGGVLDVVILRVGRRGTPEV